MPMPRGVMDSIIEDMMLQQQAGGKRYEAPLDVTKRQLGPVQQLWEHIGKKLYSDAEKAGLGNYRPIPPLNAEATPTMTATPQNVRGSMPLAPDTRERQAGNNAANWRVLVENAMREQMMKQMQAGGAPATPEWTPPEPAAYDEPQ